MDSNTSSFTEETNAGEVSKSSLSPHEIKAKIINGDFKINEKRGRSRIWSVFGTVMNDIGEVIYGVVACKSCLNIYRWNNKTTSNLVRHKCYSSLTVETHTPSPIVGETHSDIVLKVCIDSEFMKKGIRAFTQWTLENCRPFQIIDDSGFQNIAQYFVSIGAKYGQNVDISSAFPHPATISQNVTNIYGRIFGEIESEISLIKDIGFGLTAHIWDDNFLGISYIALTAHYIIEGSLYTRLLGLQSMKGQRSTSENIRKKVRNILTEFNCDLSDNATIVTNCGSKLLAAFQSYQHLFCIKHLINNVLEKAVEEVNALEDLCGLSFKLLKYFKRSDIDSSLQNTLKNYYPTPWNTKYYLLTLMQENWEEINEILREQNELHRISNINLKQLQHIISLLKPFEETLNMLEGEHYPTIHLTLIHVNRLVKKCSPESADQPLVKQFKEKLRVNLESIVIKKLTVYHKMALFLFPPANKMIQFDDDEKQMVKDKCKLMMRTYQSEIPAQRQGEKFIQLSASNQELFADYIQPTKVVSRDHALEYELLMYENTNVAFHDDFDVLNWWYHNRNEFPLLFKVSGKILATPASSATSEKIVCLARNLISEKGSPISDISSVNQIMFVNYNIGKDNIAEEINNITL